MKGKKKKVEDGDLRVERGCKFVPSGYWTRRVLRLMDFLGWRGREGAIACMLFVDVGLR
jgi:hypothetical protein